MAPPTQETARIVTAEARLRAEAQDAKAKLAAVLKEQRRNDAYEDFMARAASRTLAIPEWTRKPRLGSEHEVVAKAKFSDWHLFEVVDPAQVRYLNGYNPEIQKRRLQNYFQNIVELGFDYLRGFHFAGLVFSGLGDILSGDIHEELQRSNAETMMASLVKGVPLVAAGLKLLADHYLNVWVVWVVGNHGRNSKKPIHKGRVQNNFDWLFGQMLADRLAGDTRIQFAISAASKFAYSIYQTRFVASHMDEARGGTGISSLLAPLFIADARMRKTAEYDYWEGGHWHQRANVKRVLVNGAGKGYDEYALDSNFDFEWPQQDFSLVDPQYGLTCSWPVHVIDPSESWLANCPLTPPGRFDQAPPVRLRDLPLRMEP